ncbi:Sigma-K factor [Anaerohalosphaera lusitana]|uniref:Sigma-K factor n=1 Tax=Anaerohalosphaera lusitana TaxID=1936003 RepID=A0A1U9NKP6_9BACT|nr:sigma-70 family RNA polymerase sigma factor [Anaerohalosphaera lusitana]AQT68479.1 Sigma-K factor [Anaerohalosphaera lusitana]
MSDLDSGKTKYSDKERSDLFFKLFMANQKRIYSYILMLVPNCNDADEIMQEASAVMWQKFDEFEQGTNFGAWAVSIARFEVLNYTRKRKNSHVLFTGDMLDLFAGRAETVSGESDERMKAVQKCLEKLSKKDRRLLQMHYEGGLTIKGIAQSLDRSVQGMYKVMNRIHNSLIKCVRWRLVSEDSAC